MAVVTYAIPVFPTHVGVFPNKKHKNGCGDCLPHARGGVSVYAAVDSNGNESSPRTWGCFLFLKNRKKVVDVFPTHVGVFPSVMKLTLKLIGLPHARGGVSGERRTYCINGGSSPRTWGCFRKRTTFVYACEVFPTHVGVFPYYVSSMTTTGRLPHARGGVSGSAAWRYTTHVSSPRTWGCFCGAKWRHQLPYVFPTHVGVFPV